MKKTGLTSITNEKENPYRLFIDIFTDYSCIFFCDQSVAYNARGRMYDNVDSVQHRKAVQILGTSPISTLNGRRNYYFDHRIKAGAELYKAGKVDWLVVSGGDYRNSENGYDESFTGVRGGKYRFFSGDFSVKRQKNIPATHVPQWQAS